MEVWIVMSKSGDASEILDGVYESERDAKARVDEIENLKEFFFTSAWTFKTKVKPTKPI